MVRTLFTLGKLWYEIILLLLLNPATHVTLNGKVKIMKILIADVWCVSYSVIYKQYLFKFIYLFIWLSLILLECVSQGNFVYPMEIKTW